MRECFIIKLTGIEKITYADSFIKLNQIILKNEDGEIIIIKDRKFKKDINYEKNEIFIYLENDSTEFTERIDYLIDEDFEVEKLDLDIIRNEEKLNYNFEFLEQMDYEIVENDFIYGLECGLFKNRTACITGLKSANLYGYNYRDKRYMNLYKKVQEQCEYLINEFGVSIFITGGKIGTEAISFFAIQNLKEKYPNILNIVALPYRKYGETIKSYKTDYERHEKIMSQADFIFNVDEIQEYNMEVVPVGEFHALKDFRKDTFMIEKSKALIMFWDRKSTQCTNVINQAQVNGLNIIELRK